MERRRYNGYRGRPGAKDVLKLAAALLVLLTVLAAAVLMFAQRYIIYTDDGVRLELPFFRREEIPMPDASVSVDIIQNGPAQTQQEQVDIP